MFFFSAPSPFRRSELTLAERFFRINWLFVMFVTVIACFGFVVLYSADGGSVDRWAKPQMYRFAAGTLIMIVLSLLDLRFYMKYAYVFYVISLILLIAVPLFGYRVMGAQRWINIFGIMRLQPSELMKISMVLALARYFHSLTVTEIESIKALIFPTFLVILPCLLLAKQPDLGTAILLVMIAGSIFFMAGVRIWKFVVLGVAGMASFPAVWPFLKEYQRQRILTFLDPERDPLGAGYHILQSQITLGSGGVFGKGFLQGTQGHLNFIPEKHTDFIFTVLAEEFGIIGTTALLLLYSVPIIYGYYVAVKASSVFGKLVALGVSSFLFCYVFINVAMVMGLFPVVGVPLPLISYGGTAMMTTMVSFGLLLCVNAGKDVTLGRRSAYD